MSNEPVSLEPGLNLGRLISAERNGLAAIELAKLLQEGSASVASRLEKLDAQILELKNENQQLRVFVARQIGSQSTSE